MTQKRQLLTKSAFLSGLQCDKLLWMYQNQRDLIPEVDEATLAVMRQGHRVGDLVSSLPPRLLPKNRGRASIRNPDMS